jgi:hypothetical protein
MKNASLTMNDAELVDTLPHEQLFHTVIFILAYRLSKYQQSEAIVEEFWGSEEDLALENFAYHGTNKLMGFDINEDETWGRYLIKATADEICQYCIGNLLKKFSDYAPVSDKLFIVAKETSNIDDWSRIIRNQPDMFVFFDDKHISINCGWDQEEVDTINKLPVKYALLSFSEFSHNLIRLETSATG